MSIGAWLFARLAGVEVGGDAAGNRYFVERWASRRRVRLRRWVIYPGVADPSTVPPAWHAWLHDTANGPLPRDRHRPRQTTHTAMIGTPIVDPSDGHDLAGSALAPATTALAGLSRGAVLYTLVRHGAYAQGGDDALEDAVQLRELTQRDVYTVRAAGGLVLSGWEAALAAEDAANYPDGTRHAGAHVRGYFSGVRLGDAEIYIP